MSGKRSYNECRGPSILYSLFCLREYEDGTTVMLVLFVKALYYLLGPEL